MVTPDHGVKSRQNGSTPKRAAQVITRVLLNESGKSGVYYDEEGHTMLASKLVRDPAFTARIVSETRTRRH
jgi:hypothetical protein